MGCNSAPDLPPRILTLVEFNPRATETMKERSMIIITWRPAATVGAQPPIMRESEVPISNENRETLSGVRLRTQDRAKRIGIYRSELIRVRHVRINNTHMCKSPIEKGTEDPTFDDGSAGKGGEELGKGRLDTRDDPSRRSRVGEQRTTNPKIPKLSPKLIYIRN
eukprot:9361053-Pyramimonas_sp.AAC.1